MWTYCGEVRNDLKNYVGMLGGFGIQGEEEEEEEEEKEEEETCRPINDRGLRGRFM
jgi:hypothetical protein